MSAHLRLTVAAFSLCWAMPAAAGAQQIAGSFSQLQVLVKPGDTIIVTDSGGQEIKARITGLSPTSLALLVDGDRREFTEKDVQKIMQKRSDSLQDGALAGFCTGAGLWALAMALEGEWHGGWMLLGAAYMGGVGAGIGVGIDAMINTWQPIYAKPASSASRVTLAPMLAPGGAGVRVSWTF
ncbi:MAG: hypothetical protein AB1806_15410 [Acidobacteriota bacterium]